MFVSVKKKAKLTVRRSSNATDDIIIPRIWSQPSHFSYGTIFPLLCPHLFLLDEVLTFKQTTAAFEWDNAGRSSKLVEGILCHFNTSMNILFSLFIRNFIPYILFLVGILTYCCTHVETTFVYCFFLTYTVHIS